jgi:hypothetical protein
MWERLFGVQVGGLWAMVQALEMLAVVLAIGWLLSKIELPDRGASQINERERK